jgi:hypothetical protein
MPKGLQGGSTAKGWRIYRGGRLMKIMAKQETHKVGSVQPPNGRYTLTASEALWSYAKSIFQTAGRLMGRRVAGGSQTLADA